MCTVRKVYLKNSQNSQECNCGRVSFLTKFACMRPKTLLKKRLWHRCFPVNFATFSRTSFFNRTLPMAASEKRDSAEMF